MVSIWTTWHTVSIIIQNYIFHTHTGIDVNETCHATQVLGPRFDCVIAKRTSPVGKEPSSHFHSS